MFPKVVISILLWSLVFTMYVNRVRGAEPSQPSDCKDECDKEVTEQNKFIIKQQAEKYIKADAWADALKCYTKLIDAGFLRSACLSGRARCHHQLGHTEEAKADLAMIQKLEEEAERRGC